MRSHGLAARRTTEPRHQVQFRGDGPARHKRSLDPGLVVPRHVDRILGQGLEDVLAEEFGAGLAVVEGEEFGYSEGEEFDVQVLVGEDEVLVLG